MYQQATKILRHFFSDAFIFKYGFNLSPMYRRSTGKLTYVSDNLHKIDVKIPISYKNKNYVGSIFGGSLYAATDPIFMIQLIHILGDDYVVWDKASCIRYKKPVFKSVTVTFEFSEDEIASIKNQVDEKNEIDIVKTIELKDESGVVYTELDKTIYIANKIFYKEKLKKNKH